ncbi:MAG: bacterial transcriptional activator domain-containing protein [Chloroflexota bacterium]|jgi:DNA-binding SARP family transcriptional activator
MAYWLDFDCLDIERANWSTAKLLAAATAYQGELMPGCDTPWIMREREQLTVVFNRCMTELLRHLVDAGRWDEVITWAEHWIALGDVPEPAYRSLMRAFAARGEPNLVILTYRRCCDALAADLNVELSPQTRRLVEELGADARQGDQTAGQPFFTVTGDSKVLAAARAQAELERRRADVYLW